MSVDSYFEFYFERVRKSALSPQSLELYHVKLGSLVRSALEKVRLLLPYHHLSDLASWRTASTFSFLLSLSFTLGYVHYSLRWFWSYFRNARHNAVCPKDGVSATRGPLDEMHGYLGPPGGDEEADAQESSAMPEGHEYSILQEIFDFGQTWKYLSGQSPTPSSAPLPLHLSILNLIKAAAMLWAFKAHVFVLWMLYQPTGKAWPLLDQLTSHVVFHLTVFGATFAVDAFLYTSGVLTATRMLPLFHDAKTNAPASTRTDAREHAVCVKVPRSPLRARLRSFANAPLIRDLKKCAIILTIRYLRVIGPLVLTMLAIGLVPKGLVTPAFHDALKTSFLDGRAGGCRKYWLWTVLLTQAYYPLNVAVECMPWAWYMSNDFLFLALALMALVLFKFARRFSIGFFGTLVVFFYHLTYDSVYSNNITSVIKDFRISGATPLPPESPMIFESYPRYFTQYYVLPWARFPPYLIGFAVGLYVHQKSRRNSLLGVRCTRSKEAAPVSARAPVEKRESAIELKGSLSISSCAAPKEKLPESRRPTTRLQQASLFNAVKNEADNCGSTSTVDEAEGRSEGSSGSDALSGERQAKSGYAVSSSSSAVCKTASSRGEVTICVTKTETCREGGGGGEGGGGEGGGGTSLSALTTDPLLLSSSAPEGIKCSRDAITPKGSFQQGAGTAGYSWDFGACGSASVSTFVPGSGSGMNDYDSSSSQYRVHLLSKDGEPGSGGTQDSSGVCPKDFATGTQPDCTPTAVGSLSGDTPVWVTNEKNVGGDGCALVNEQRARADVVNCGKEPDNKCPTDVSLPGFPGCQTEEAMKRTNTSPSAVVREAFAWSYVDFVDRLCDSTRIHTRRGKQWVLFGCALLIVSSFCSNNPVVAAYLWPRTADVAHLVWSRTVWTLLVALLHVTLFDDADDAAASERHPLLAALSSSRGVVGLSRLGYSFYMTQPAIIFLMLGRLGFDEWDIAFNLGADLVATMSLLLCALPFAVLCAFLVEFPLSNFGKILFVGRARKAAKKGDFVELSPTPPGLVTDS